MRESVFSTFRPLNHPINASILIYLLSSHFVDFLLWISFKNLRWTVRFFQPCNVLIRGQNISVTRPLYLILYITDLKASIIITSSHKTKPKDFFAFHCPSVQKSILVYRCAINPCSLCPPHNFMIFSMNIL